MLLFIHVKFIREWSFDGSLDLGDFFSVKARVVQDLPAFHCPLVHVHLFRSDSSFAYNLFNEVFHADESLPYSGIIFCASESSISELELILVVVIIQVMVSRCILVLCFQHELLIVSKLGPQSIPLLF